MLLNQQFYLKRLIYVNMIDKDITKHFFYSSRFKKTYLVVNLICTLSGALLIMNSGHLYKYIAGHNLTSHPTKKQQLLLFILKIWLQNFCHLSSHRLKLSTYIFHKKLMYKYDIFVCVFSCLLCV